MFTAVYTVYFVCFRVSDITNQWHGTLSLGLYRAKLYPNGNVSCTAYGKLNFSLAQRTIRAAVRVF